MIAHRILVFKSPVFLTGIDDSETRSYTGERSLADVNELPARVRSFQMICVPFLREPCRACREFPVG